jgi:hypothetical protein
VRPPAPCTSNQAPIVFRLGSYKSVQSKIPAHPRPSHLRKLADNPKRLGALTLRRISLLELMLRSMLFRISAVIGVIVRWSRCAQRSCGGKLNKPAARRSFRVINRSMKKLTYACVHIFTTALQGSGSPRWRSPHQQSSGCDGFSRRSDRSSDRVHLLTLLFPPTLYRQFERD